MTRDVTRNLMNHFRRIVQALRSSHRAAEHLNLTAAQLYVINVVGEAGRPLGVNELADRTKTDQSTVSVVTRRLVERKLLRRARGRADSRRVELSLTAEGRALQEKAPATMAQQRLTAAVEALPPADAGELLRLMNAIIAWMDLEDEPVRMLFDEPPPADRKRRADPPRSRPPRSKR